MALSQQSLEAKLTTPVRYFDSVDSTNDIAKQWLANGADAFSAVIADEQRKGRGRKGRVWHTPPGVALAASIILKPMPDRASTVSMMGALAVVDLCEAAGIQEIGIKWPNDVQIGGKKVSGILPEAVWDDGVLHGVVLGIGVNVRVQFDDELAATATSLEAACACQLNRDDLAAQLIERIIFWTQQADTNIVDAWKARLKTLGQHVAIEDIAGKAVAVDEVGALLIEGRDGSIRRVLAGDISLLPSQDEGK